MSWVNLAGNFTCLYCYKKDDIENLEPLCNKCYEDGITNNIKYALSHVINKDYLWKDKDCYEGFETEEEKELFMKGVKHGFASGLFWIADYFGNEMVKYYEKIEI